MGGFAVCLDEKGIRIGLDQCFQLHQMEGHLQQPLSLAALLFTTLKVEEPQATTMVGIGLFRTIGFQPTGVFRQILAYGSHPGSKRLSQKSEFLFRFVDIDMMEARENLRNARGFG